MGASDLLAPLPNLRLQGFYAFTPRLAALASVGWFSASYDEYDGRFLYWHLRGHLLLTDHFGISLGYQVTDVDVSRDGKRRYEEYEIDFTGPTLQLTLGF